MKEIVRSPFGQIIRDTNTGMDLSIDFAGGLIDQYTNLVHIGDRVYDPVLGQWMTPDWTRICKPGAMKNPTDVFSYRFNGNDPINRKKTATNLMSGKDLFLFFLCVLSFSLLIVKIRQISPASCLLKVKYHPKFNLGLSELNNEIPCFEFLLSKTGSFNCFRIFPIRKVASFYL